jgi:uncharacterized protein involved in response to NO
VPDDALRVHKSASFTELPRLISAAPHRLLFAAGASAVIVSMLWWAIVLVGARSGWSLPAPPLPPGWAHALLAQYGMLGPFLFGFLLTVFPRWLNQPALTRYHYVPVFAGVFGGYLIAHAGLFAGMPVFATGLALMIAGWIAGLVVLLRVLVAAGRFDQHAVSCYAALLCGGMGLILFAVALATQRWALAPAAIKLGTFGLLLPIYFTVCHRMVPFFSANLVPGYRMIRPRWSLLLLWLFALAHLVLELIPAPRWLWLVDAPFALYFLAHSIAWQPWKARVSGLLFVLHLALLWLPFAFALYTVQSAVLFAGGDAILGRAPVHALTVGFFGSMLVAMVTRVTQGHSGRPLVMGTVPWICFIGVQGVALLRVVAEASRDPTYWFAVAACAWVVAFLPWVLRSLWIYGSPRADGAPG